MGATAVCAAMSELSKLVRRSLPAEPGKKKRLKTVPVLVAVNQLEQPAGVEKGERIGRVGARHVRPLKSIAGRSSGRLCAEVADPVSTEGASQLDGDEQAQPVLELPPARVETDRLRRNAEAESGDDRPTYGSRSLLPSARRSSRGNRCWRIEFHCLHCRSSGGTAPAIQRPRRRGPV